MGLLADLLFERTSVYLERGEEGHDLSEDLLVGLRELTQPTLEQRVVPDFQTHAF